MLWPALLAMGAGIGVLLLASSVRFSVFVPLGLDQRGRIQVHWLALRLSRSVDFGDRVETAFRRALDRALAGEHEPGARKAPAPGAIDWSRLQLWRQVARRAGRPVRRALRYLQPRLRWQRLRVGLQLGVDDPALTAWSCGTAWATAVPAIRALAVRAGVPPRLTRVGVAPKFGGTGAALVIDAQASVRVFSLLLGGVIALPAVWLRSIRPNAAGHPNRRQGPARRGHPAERSQGFERSSDSGSDAHGPGKSPGNDRRQYRSGRPR